MAKQTEHQKEERLDEQPEWESLSFAMFRCKELSPAAKGVLKVWLKMNPEKAAQEAALLAHLMSARLTDKERS